LRQRITADEKFALVIPSKNVRVELQCELLPEERDVLLAGGTLNFIKMQSAAGWNRR